MMESAVVVEAAKRVLPMGERTVIVAQRICRYELRDSECPDTVDAFSGPALSASTLSALEANFGRGRVSGVPPSLRLQRPLLLNDTVHVLMQVTRAATDMPSHAKGCFDRNEFDVRLSIASGSPRVLSCDVLTHATLCEEPRRSKPWVEELMDPCAPPNQALQSDSGAIDGALRALLFDAAAAERKR
jgi:hypothetical protein